MTYCQLTEAERYLIASMRGQRKSMRQIAARLGRHRSTIYREVQRNKTPQEQYVAEKAQSYAQARRRRSRRKPQYSRQEQATVAALLARRWSPKQISGWHRRRGRKLRISAQTIYRWIKRDRSGGGELWRYTRIISKFGRKRYRSVDYRGVLPGKRHISQRPRQVQRRRQVGHWEADTVMGSDMRHCILTLLERATGYVVIKKLAARTKEETTTALLRVLVEHGRKIKTLTFDNGTEFHGYKELERQFKVKCYFATPYRSWERGSNENANGLIRQYLPKGMCMGRVTQKDCNWIARELNTRPRERYGFRTPAELYARA